MIFNIEDFTFDEVCLVDIVDDRQFELVPSEKHAESEEVTVVGWFWVILIGDFDDDECKLLGRRRGMILIDVDREFVFVLSFRMDWKRKEYSMENHIW